MTLRQAAGERGLLIGAACIPEVIQAEAQYRESLAREFNCIVAENVMKPLFLQPERSRFDFSLADSLVAFARANNMKLRGHTLVWHQALPKWVEGVTFPKDEALTILRDHIHAVVTHFRGSVFCWDVVNEALSDEGGWRESSPWFQMIGPDYMEHVFRYAHEADPDAKLFYNDYGMEHPNGKADACYAMLKDLLARGVPIHGMGFQCHAKAKDKPDVAACIANIRRFADLGLDIHFTEIDMWVKTPVTEALRQEQAATYADWIRIALDSRAVSALLFWGFTDRYSWVPHFTKHEYDEALLLDANYQRKLAYEAVLKALST